MSEHMIGTKTYYIDTWKDKVKAIYLIIIGKIAYVNEIIVYKEFYK